MRALMILASHGLVPVLTPVDLLVLRTLYDLLDRTDADDGARDAAVAAFIVKRRHELARHVCEDVGLSIEALDALVGDDDVRTVKKWYCEADCGRWRDVASALVHAEEIRRAAIDVAERSMPADALLRRVGALGNAELSACFTRLFAEKPKLPASSKVISVQIDMAGSTHAKACARKMAGDDEALRQEAYESLYEALIAAEVAFYTQLQSSDDGVPGVELTQCFGVKGIGDEQWSLVVPASDQATDLSNAILRVLAAAQHVASQIQWLELRSSALVDDAESFQDSHLIALPFKVFVDLIGDDAIDVSAMRVAAYCEAIAKRKLFISDLRSLPDIATRLTNQSVFAGLGSLRFATRADYIGWEIDRLFRAAKFAVPGVVTVGDSLMRALGATPTDGLGPIATFESCFQRSFGSAIVNSLRKLSRCIDADELRGIGEEYAVHHVFRSTDLRGLHAAVMRETGEDAVFDKTVEALRVRLDRLPRD
ncbi:MAG TPA: hypothetical protein VJ724_04725 [Tahibacter sp.]|nr:hypothetical protein [Tahibacter sp.]